MSDINYELDFSGHLPIAAQYGMANADSHADSTWKRYVDGCIQAVAMEKAFFTVDDVLGRLDGLPNPPSTHNLCAIGPRLLEVSKTLKYMTPTKELKRSKRPEKHGRFLRVWRSNLK